MKKVFLIFAEQDAGKVKNLLPLLNSPEMDLDFYVGPLDADFDSPEADPDKRAMGEKIVKCTIAACLISEHTHNSKWVDLQLQKNRNKGNRIIAMALKGTVDAVLPVAVREENLKFHPWDPAKLKKLISEDTGKLFDNSR
jgi:hypothetical protein